MEKSICSVKNDTKNTHETKSVANEDDKNKKLEECEMVNQGQRCKVIFKSLQFLHVYMILLVCLHMK